MSFEHLALRPEQAKALVEREEDATAITDYMASGANLWNRDLRILEGVEKVELEALDPTDLREMVVRAIDSAIDPKVLKQVASDEEAERNAMRTRLTALADQFDKP